MNDPNHGRGIVWVFDGPCESWPVAHEHDAYCAEQKRISRAEAHRPPCGICRAAPPAAPRYGDPLGLYCKSCFEKAYSANREGE